MSQTSFSASQIERMLITVARVIDAHGDAYVPLFEMLERELEAAQKKNSALDRARRLARSGS